MKYTLYALAFLGLIFLTQCNKTPDLTFGNIMYVDNGEPQPVVVGGGKKTVIHFYASWCTDCLREMPDANKLLSEAPEDLRVYYLTDDTPERRDLLNKRFNIPFPTYQLEKSLKSNGVHYLPLTYFIDENGTRQMAQAEQIDWHSNEIKSFLGYPTHE